MIEHSHVIVYRHRVRRARLQRGDRITMLQVLIFGFLVIAIVIAGCGPSSVLRPGVPCQSNADCDDGAFCTGEETCLNGQCAAVQCVPCTEEGYVCNEVFNACIPIDADACLIDAQCSAFERCDRERNICTPPFTT